MPRIELRDGQWAELRDRISHGKDKELLKAAVRGRENPEDAFDYETELVRAFVRDWYVRDPDGQVIPIGEPDAIERAPEDIIDELYVPARDAYRGATVPNSPTPASSAEVS